MTGARPDLTQIMAEKAEMVGVEDKKERTCLKGAAFCIGVMAACLLAPALAVPAALVPAINTAFHASHVGGFLAGVGGMIFGDRSDKAKKKLEDLKAATGQTQAPLPVAKI